MELKHILKLKKVEPYKKQRMLSKPINFGSIFGAKVPMLSILLKNGGVSEKDCEKIINDMELQESLEETVEKYGKQMDMLACKYYTLAKFARKNFFDAYPGLQERINREMIFALKHGYVRHWQGPMRHTPELLLLHFKENNNPTFLQLDGADRSFHMSLLNNVGNVLANSEIQGAEFPHILLLVGLFRQTYLKWKKIYPFKSSFFNNVHDSLDMYLHKDEIPVVIPLLYYCLEYPVAPGLNVPIPIDIELADMTNPKHTYKHGDEIGDSIYKKYIRMDLQKAINEFCKEKNIEKLPMPEIPKHEDGKEYYGFLPPENELYINKRKKEKVRRRIVIED